MAKSTEQLCREFLTEFEHGISPDERLIVSYPSEATVQTDENGKKINSGFWPQAYKDGNYLKSESNAYVCISSSIKTANPKTGEMRYWRGEASFARGHGFFVDDIGDGKGSKGNMSLEWLSSILPPTAVVETSPGNFQCWYFFDDPIDNMAYFKAFLHCFVENVLEGAGGDVTIKDVARYGRIPIGINNKRLNTGEFKYADDKGRPFRVRLVSADYSKRYSVEAIAKAFRFEIILPQRKRVVVDAEEYAFDSVWLDIAVDILGELGMGEGSNGEMLLNQSGKYRIFCPWGHEHTNGDPYGAYIRGPIPGADYAFVFGCGHDTCRKENKRTWATFTDEIVMPRIEGNLAFINADDEWTTLFGSKLKPKLWPADLKRKTESE